MSTSATPHQPTRIVIVGGVAGGMSCAARARRLDESAEIIVLERGPHVSFANCGLPYFVGGEITRPESLLVQTPDRLRAALALDVRPGHDVVGLDPDAKELTVRIDGEVIIVSYDALVLSPGAGAVMPQIEGIDSPRVRTLRTVDDAIALRDEVDAGAEKAVVLGAGFIGLEAAEALASRGLSTTVVQSGPHVLAPLDAEHAWLVHEELERIGVDVHVDTRATRIERGPGHDVVVLSDGARVSADLIVVAIGARPDTSVFAEAGVATENDAIVIDGHGRTSLPDVWAVGDARFGEHRRVGPGADRHHDEVGAHACTVG
ncbi:MAG: pyridine nucleotide-disulfide oxidoreductase, partial [Microbacterium sp.]